MHLSPTPATAVSLALAWIAALALCGCGSPDSKGDQKAFDSAANREPNQQAAGPGQGNDPNPPGSVEIRIENLQIVPPLINGLVDPEHPKYRALGSLPMGYKRIPADVLAAALRRLGELGFEESSRPTATLGPANPLHVLRRLSVETDEGIRVFIVPRKPQRAVAQEFGRFVGPLLDVYNRIESPRLAPKVKDPYYFEKESIRLERKKRKRESESP